MSSLIAVWKYARAGQGAVPPSRRSNQVAPWSSLAQTSAQITLSPGTDHERPILRAAFRLLRTHWDQAALRLIGIGVTVVPPATGEYQPELFDLTLPLSSEDAALDVEIVGMRQGRE